MPPTKIPVLPFKVTGHLSNARKDKYPRTGWEHPSCHPSVCTTNFTNLHDLLSLGSQCTSTPLLSLSHLLRLQTGGSVLSDSTSEARMVQSHSLNRPSLSVHPFFQLLPQIQAFQDLLQGAACSKTCILFTFGFLSPAAFITPKASS